MIDLLDILDSGALSIKQKKTYIEYDTTYTKLGDSWRKLRSIPLDLKPFVVPEHSVTTEELLALNKVILSKDSPHVRDQDIKIWNLASTIGYNYNYNSYYLYLNGDAKQGFDFKNALFTVHKGTGPYLCIVIQNYRNPSHVTKNLIFDNRYPCVCFLHTAYFGYYAGDAHTISNSILIATNITYRFIHLNGVHVIIKDSIIVANMYNSHYNGGNIILKNSKVFKPESPEGRHVLGLIDQVKQGKLSIMSVKKELQNTYGIRLISR